MKQLAQQAMETARLKGARYADMRIIESRTQTAGVKDGVVDALGDFESMGFGVRVLVGIGVSLGAVVCVGARVAVAVGGSDVGVIVGGSVGVIVGDRVGV